MAPLVDVATAIASALTGAVFSPPYASVTAERTYNAVYDLEKTSALAVFVVASNTVTSRVARTVRQNEIQIDVGVEKKLAKADNAELDLLMELVKEIGEFIDVSKTFADYRVINVANDPAFSPEHLEKLRVFLSVLTITLLKVGT